MFYILAHFGYYQHTSGKMKADLSTSTRFFNPTLYLNATSLIYWLTDSFMDGCLAGDVNIKPIACAITFSWVLAFNNLKPIHSGYYFFF